MHRQMRDPEMPEQQTEGRATYPTSNLPLPTPTSHTYRPVLHHGPTLQKASMHHTLPHTGKLHPAPIHLHQPVHARDTAQLPIQQVAAMARSAPNEQAEGRCRRDQGSTSNTDGLDCMTTSPITTCSSHSLATYSTLHTGGPSTSKTRMTRCTLRSYLPSHSKSSAWMTTRKTCDRCPCDYTTCIPYTSTTSRTVSTGSPTTRKRSTSRSSNEPSHARDQNQHRIRDAQSTYGHQGCTEARLQVTISNHSLTRRDS